MTDKLVDANFGIYFTTDKTDKLPSAYKLNQELTRVFAEALDKYLDGLGVDYFDVHAITGSDNLTIEDVDDE